MGWLQLSRFEAHLQERAAAEEAASDEGHEAQGYPTFQASLKAGPQSSSQLCAAMLEAAGVLPHAQGAEGEAAGRAGEGGASVAAAAVMHLQLRRRLYDTMEASLLDRGLSLGGCCCLHAAAAALAGGCNTVTQPLRPALGEPVLPTPAAAAAGTATTQGLGLGDLFTRHPATGALQPVLVELAVPVRAVVLPLTDKQAAG